MARQMTREERIRYYMEQNKSDSSYSYMTATRGYCEALVDGQIAVEQMKQLADGPIIKPITDHFKVEKKTMTRDEARKVLYGTCVESLEFKDALIECLEALGLIKFEEPKSLELRFQEAVKPIYGFNLSEIELINNRLHMVGLKIVEK